MNTTEASNPSAGKRLITRYSHLKAALMITVLTIPAVSHATTDTYTYWISVPTVTVLNNSSEYNEIQEALIGFKGRIKIVTGHTGYVKSWSAWLRIYSGGPGFGRYDPPDWDDGHTYHRPRPREVTKTVHFAGPLNPELRYQLVSVCNNKAAQLRQQGRSDQFIFENDHKVNVKVTLELHTDTYGGTTSPVPLEGIPGASSPTHMKVICAKNVEAEIQAAPAPASVDVRVKQIGDTCPKKTEVTAYINYEKKTTAKFRVRHNGQLSELISIKTRKVEFAGKEFYQVKRIQTYHLDPGKHNFRIEVRGGQKSQVEKIDSNCPPFQVANTWLDYEVEDTQTCPKRVVERASFYANQPGDIPYKISIAGGLVVDQGIAYASREGDKYVARRKRKVEMNAFDQMMRVEVTNNPAINDQKPLKIDCLEVVAGTLQLNGFEPSRCEGEAALSIRTSMEGKVPYQLDCTGGHSWKRTVQTQKTGTNTFIGVDKVKFDVANNEQVNCALKTRKPLESQVLTLAGQEFKCINVNPDVAGGADGRSSGPTDPVDHGRFKSKLKGDFSFVDFGGTKCSREVKALINFEASEPDNIHYSLDCTNGHFSGVAQTIASENGGFVAPALVSFDITKNEHINCALKTVAPGKPKVHMLKGRDFQCFSTNIPTVGGITLEPKIPKQNVSGFGSKVPAGLKTGRTLKLATLATNVNQTKKSPVQKGLLVAATPAAPKRPEIALSNIGAATDQGTRLSAVEKVRRAKKKTQTTMVAVRATSKVATVQPTTAKKPKKLGKPDVKIIGVKRSKRKLSVRVRNKRGHETALNCTVRANIVRKNGSKKAVSAPVAVVRPGQTVSVTLDGVPRKKKTKKVSVKVNCPGESNLANNSYTLN